MADVRRVCHGFALRGSLGAAFTACAKQTRARAAERRTAGLKNLRYDDGSELRFKRADIPQEMLNDLAEANALDVALHATGVQLFERRRAQLAKDGLLEELRADGSIARLDHV
jgi:hypothetical protein